MGTRKRRMHLAVFWLGTGNHIAGWRMDGAYDSNCSWPIAEAGARIADTLQDWFEAGLADGFMIQPAYFPGAFDDFVDLVVPELQRRGVLRREYAGRRCGISCGRTLGESCRSGARARMGRIGHD